MILDRCIKNEYVVSNSYDFVIKIILQKLHKVDVVMFESNKSAGRLNHTSVLQSYFINSISCVET